MKRSVTTALLFLAGCTTESGITEPQPCQAARAGCPSSTSTAKDPLVPQGRAETSSFIEITDIVAHGEIAYVCTGVRGLSIFDTSSDGAPRRLVEGVAPGDSLSNDRFPRCQHVAFDPDASRLVITNRGDEVQPRTWLAVYDVADPRRPALEGVWVPPSGSIEGVEIRGDRIFAAMHGQGVAALRLSPQGSIEETGRAREDGTDAWQPVLAGDRLVVAEGEAGVRVYAAVDDSLALIETVALEGSSRDVLVDDTRAYVATSGGVAVVEIADAPRALAEHAVAGSPLDLARLGPGQIAVAEWDALRGYDLSTPETLTPLFSEVVPTEDTFSRVLAVGAVAERGRVYGGEWTGFHGFAFSPEPGPEVELTPSALQFGDVDDTDARVLLVSNRGTTPLTVFDITGTSDVTIDETCFVVEPGRSTAVEVQLELSSPVTLRSSIRVCSDDPDEPEVDLPLSANVGGIGLGDPAPTFALQDLEGNMWSSADLEGKVAVLAYFATF